MRSRSTKLITSLHHTTWLVLTAIVGFAILLTILNTSSIGAAINQIPPPDPQPGSYGIEATKPKAPPIEGASIATPSSGASFTTSPITVRGICPEDLLVQVHNNGVMVGAVMCEDGSFELEVSLFAGVNELTAHVYDELYQTGPVSNIATVNYTNAHFTAFGELITLTSQYGRRSAMTIRLLGHCSFPAVRDRMPLVLTGVMDHQLS
jgi:hypothetical protein